MKAVLILSFHVLVLILQAKAWQTVRNPFERMLPPQKQHIVTDCMHVTSEDGVFSFKKAPRFVQSSQHAKLIDIETITPAMDVCGIYFVTDPDKYVEVTVQYLDVDCETGGLMAFVDGWELNGQYFPSVKDHHLSLEERVQEFCNDNKHWPTKTTRKLYKSSQNAALLQYRIPIRGSFKVSVRYVHNPQPCHIMAEGVAPYYTLKNTGGRNNCTLTALFPAVVSVVAVDVGPKGQDVNYDCDHPDTLDKLDIGGSSGLDSYNLEKSSTVCGKSDKMGPEQAIFCGVTTVRLSSSGNYHNQALVAIRTADDNDINIATVVCEI